MTATDKALEWLLEAGVLAWLLWSASSQYALVGAMWPLPIVILYAPVALIAWVRLRRKVAVPRIVLLRLIGITGLSLCLSLYLLLGPAVESDMIRRAGGSTKEMVTEAWRRGVPGDYVDQWNRDYAAEVRARRDTYLVISALLCLACWRSYRAACGPREPQACSSASPVAKNS